MTRHPNLKIIAFVGLTGSGKSTAVEYLTNKDIPRVYFGGVILDAMTEAGLEHTQENEKPFREALREKEGKDFVVKRIIDQIHRLADAGQHRIVADGIYSWTEYKAMKKEFPGELTVVATIVPKHIRYHRLANRPIRPLTEKGASERDWAEIENIEKGGPIAIADFYISNENSVDHFEKQIDAVLETIEF